MDLTHQLSISKSRCSALQDASAVKPGPAFVEPLRLWLTTGEPPALREQPQVPAPPGGPAQTNGQHNTRPKDGKELLARLQEFERKLVLEAKCRPNELLAAVRAAGAKVKLTGPVNEWQGNAIDLAIRTATAFSQTTPDGDSIRELSRKLGWSAQQVMAHVTQIAGVNRRPDTLTREEASQIILDLEDRLQLQTAGAQ